MKLNNSGLVAASQAICITAAMADGLALNGHISGRHRDLVLTAAQRQSLDQMKGKIVLTPEQKKQLEDIPAGKAIREISVFSSSTQTCTCDLANVGIRTSSSTVEVALDLFGRDLIEEARVNQLMFKKSQDKRFAEQHTHRGSKELSLYEQGQKCCYEQPDKAIPFFEQALQINPAFSCARDQLQCAWNNYGVKKEHNKDYQGALICFQNAMNYKNFWDRFFVTDGQKNIARVTEKLKAQKRQQS